MLIGTSSVISGCWRLMLYDLKNSSSHDSLSIRKLVCYSLLHSALMKNCQHTLINQLHNWDTEIAWIMSIFLCIFYFPNFSWIVLLISILLTNNCLMCMVFAAGDEWTWREHVNLVKWTDVSRPFQLRLCINRVILIWQAVLVFNPHMLISINCWTFIDIDKGIIDIDISVSVNRIIDIGNCLSILINM